MARGTVEFADSSMSEDMALRPVSLNMRLAQGVLWSLTGAVIWRGLTVVSLIIVARFIGQVEFGKLSMIQNTIGMFSVFAGLGLGLTATKYVAQFRAHDAAKVGRILGLASFTATISGILMALALFVLAPSLAASTMREPQLAWPLQIAAGQLLLGALSGLQTGALSGFEAFRAIAKVNLATGLLSFPIIISGVKSSGLNGVLWAMLVVSVINVALNHIVLQKECHRAGVSVSFADCLIERHVLWSFSLPAVTSNAMIAPVTWLTSTFLVNQPNGYAEIGIFNAANQWGLLLLFIPTSMAQMLISILSERFGGGQKRSANQVLKSVVLVVSAITLPLAAILALLSPWIMGYYGPQFYRGWPVLCTIALASSLLAIQTPIGNAIAAMDRMWTGFFMNAGWAVVMLASAFLLVKKGALGLAAAFLISYTLHGTWTFWFAQRTLNHSDVGGQKLGVRR